MAWAICSNFKLHTIEISLNYTIYVLYKIYKSCRDGKNIKTRFLKEFVDPYQLLLSSLISIFKGFTESLFRWKKVEKIPFLPRT